QLSAEREMRCPPTGRLACPLSFGGVHVVELDLTVWELLQDVRAQRGLLGQLPATYHAARKCCARWRTWPMPSTRGTSRAPPRRGGPSSPTCWPDPLTPARTGWSPSGTPTSTPPGCGPPGRPPGSALARSPTCSR